MGKIARAVEEIKNNPYIIYLYFDSWGLLKSVKDEKWAKIMWKARTGKTLNLEKPKGFNEKLQWLMLYNHRPEYTTMVDKLKVRDYIADTIGEQYLIPLIGVWENAKDIDFSLLPNEFVLKCNNNSGRGMCVCKDKNKLDFNAIRSELNRALGENYYNINREWPYKNIEPRIICEKYMVDSDPTNTTGTLIDYKFYCFDGEPRFLYVGIDDVSAGKKGELKLSFFDMEWKTTQFYREDHKPIPLKVKKPSTFDEMASIARILSKDIPFVRVDLYSIDDRVYFSELTFFPGAGFGLFSPPEWEEKLGNMIVLPQKFVEN